MNEGKLKKEYADNYHGLNNKYCNQNCEVA
jgi:hypothetical protein